MQGSPGPERDGNWLVGKVTGVRSSCSEETLLLSLGLEKFYGGNSRNLSAWSKLLHTWFKFLGPTFSGFKIGKGKFNKLFFSYEQETFNPGWHSFMMTFTLAQ